MPTLVLWGRNDEILDVKLVDKFPEELPGAQIVFVDRCGHSPHLEQAGIVAGIILDTILPFDDEVVRSDEGDSEEILEGKEPVQGVQLVQSVIIEKDLLQLVEVFSQS